jgi:hypothetical protein
MLNPWILFFCREKYEILRVKNENHKSIVFLNIRLYIGDYFESFETHISMVSLDQCFNTEKWGVLAHLGYR